VTSTADNGTKGGKNKVNGNGVKTFRYICDLKIVTNQVAGGLTATFSLVSSNKK
jgi:hypothetical protein